MALDDPGASLHHRVSADDRSLLPPPASTTPHTRRQAGKAGVQAVGADGGAQSPLQVTEAPRLSPVAVSLS